MHILHGFDEVGLPEDEINDFRFFDFDALNVHVLPPAIF
jgi:hypothetical protein